MDDWKEGVDGVYCSGLEAMDSPLDQASAHAGRDGLEGNWGLGRGRSEKVWGRSCRGKLRPSLRGGQLTFSWIVEDIVERQECPSVMDGWNAEECPTSMVGLR